MVIKKPFEKQTYNQRQLQIHCFMVYRSITDSKKMAP